MCNKFSFGAKANARIHIVEEDNHLLTHSQAEKSETKHYDWGYYFLMHTGLTHTNIRSVLFAVRGTVSQFDCISEDLLFKLQKILSVIVHNKQFSQLKFSSFKNNLHKYLINLSDAPGRLSTTSTETDNIYKRNMFMNFINMLWHSCVSINWSELLFQYEFKNDYFIGVANEVNYIHLVRTLLKIHPYKYNIIEQFLVPSSYYVWWINKTIQYSIQVFIDFEKKNSFND